MALRCLSEISQVSRSSWRVSLERSQLPTLRLTDYPKNWPIPNLGLRKIYLCELNELSLKPISFPVSLPL